MTVGTVLRAAVVAASVLFARGPCLAAVAGEGGDTSRAQPPLPTERVALDTRTGRHVLLVEVARTPAEREVGLMHRDGVAADGGMLFAYPDAAPRAFWMRDVPFALDVVFVAADGTVTGVSADAAPMSDVPIPSPGPAAAVLELPGGAARGIGLVPGDHVWSLP